MSFKLTNDSLAADAQESIICTAAYLDVPAGATIPNTHRWFQTYLEWLAVPNTPDPFESAQEISDRLRAERIAELKVEGLTRIQAEMPAINNFDTLELVREMWLSIDAGSRSATVTFQSIIDIYQAARDAVVFLKSATDPQIAAYDVVNDPTWPV
jgi:hypothetical protein